MSFAPSGPKELKGALSSAIVAVLLMNPPKMVVK
jgi:hypothetical protein